MSSQINRANTDQQDKPVSSKMGNGTSSQINKANTDQQGSLGEIQSFHKELLMAEKKFEQQKDKPKGKYNSTWKTSVDESTEKGPQGIYLTTQRTEMASTYSHDNTGYCVIF